MGVGWWARRGVHYLRDPYTKKFNFDPYLQKIRQPAMVDLTALPSFVRPSQDEVRVHGLCYVWQVGSAHPSGASHVGGRLESTDPMGPRPVDQAALRRVNVLADGDAVPAVLSDLALPAGEHEPAVGRVPERGTITTMIA